MTERFMECGCTAMVNDVDGKPVCFTHMPDPKAYKVAEKPSLEGRQARCSYDNGAGCGNNGHRRDVRDSRVDSSVGLAFFKYHADRDYDEYYCGCWGWD